MTRWTPPNEYPYVDSDAKARCRLWFHGKAIVRLINLEGRLVERYDCRCGKYYWLSQEDGHGPLTRHRR